MRPLNSPEGSNQPVVERRKNRRQAYFHGKYAKETLTLVIATGVFGYYFLMS